MYGDDTVVYLRGKGGCWKVTQWNIKLFFFQNELFVNLKKGKNNEYDSIKIFDLIQKEVDT